MRSNSQTRGATASVVGAGVVLSRCLLEDNKFSIVVVVVVDPSRCRREDKC